MLAIGALEVLALLAGFSPSASIEAALPEIDLPDAPELSGAEFGPFSLILGWLSVGRLPLLVLLIILLSSFAITGYSLQWATIAATGAALPPLLASLVALVGGAFGMRHFGRWLGRIFPRDHSEAASQAELVGSYATIIRGEAKPGQPAEAKAQDLRGRTHYLLVEPRDADARFAAGARVFIVSRNRTIYRAVDRLDPTEDPS
ncbi:Protein of unknown function [Devosia enhydra]|uniref:Membrane protein implicated in regulation of membrane protease activity n=2 Tax=Devosia enhydra TaxID=665118 RepID=A0A1K2HT09_9HYPH|nr:Protein of unknown function [Devosia enhydra]